VQDEPANGLDAVGTRHVHRVLARLAADGASVVLSSHRMDDLTALCTEVSLLARGRVVFSGPVSKLAAETGEINYRLRTSDSAAARRLADGTPVATLYGTPLPHIKWPHGHCADTSPHSPDLRRQPHRAPRLGVGVLDTVPFSAPTLNGRMATATPSPLPSFDLHKCFQ